MKLSSVVSGALFVGCTSILGMAWADEASLGVDSLDANEVQINQAANCIHQIVESNGAGNTFLSSCPSQFPVLKTGGCQAFGSELVTSLPVNFRSWSCISRRSVPVIISAIICCDE